MNPNDKLELFTRKGYCILEKPTKRFEKKDKRNYLNYLIDQVLQGIDNNYTYCTKEITYGDENINDHVIFYNCERVDIDVIKCLSDFVELVCKNKASIEDSHSTFYRGHSNVRYYLEPSIYRKENKSILENEDRMYRDILSSKPHFFSDCRTTLERLVKMQHHGIPTRLLDLSENPLIALFFACENTRSNGEVLVFKVSDSKIKYYDSDTVSLLTNLTKCPYSFDVSDYYGLSESKNDECFRSKKEICELVHYIREDKPYFSNEVLPSYFDNYSLVVKPKMSIDRIINQSGAFILFGIDRKKSSLSSNNISVSKYKQKIFIIPSEYKSKILNELIIFNINRSTVFCDIDTTAKYFSSKYKGSTW